MFLLLNVHVLNWATVVQVFHSEKNAAKDLKRFPSHLGTVKTKMSMFFPESKSMFLFQQICRLKMFLFPNDILGWCSSAQCSSAYDFTVVLKI